MSACNTPAMKTFFLTAIVSGYASYYLIRGCFNVLLWLLNHELTVTQRSVVIENGYLAFVAGMMVGMVVCWKIRNWDIERIKA